MANSTYFDYTDHKFPVTCLLSLSDWVTILMCGQLNRMHEVCQRQWCAATNEGLLLKPVREVGTVKAGAGAAAGNLHH